MHANTMIPQAVKTPITAVLLEKKLFVARLVCVWPAGLLTIAVIVRREVPSDVKYVVVTYSGGSVGELPVAEDEDKLDTDVLDWLVVLLADEDFEVELVLWEDGDKVTVTVTGGEVTVAGSVSGGLMDVSVSYRFHSIDDIDHFSVPL